jgi:hypothetical protein
MKRRTEPHYPSNGRMEKRPGTSEKEREITVFSRRRQREEVEVEA